MRLPSRRAALALAFNPSLSPLLRRPTSFPTKLSPTPAFRPHPAPCRVFACASAPALSTLAQPTSESPLPQSSTTPPTFQEALQRLQNYWAEQGCIIWHPHNVEVGAGTMNPATFLRVLGPEPWSVAYDEPSIRPDDSRYAANPNRLQRHTQFQVIVKPAPECAQELVVASYRALGIDTCKHDIRFVEDNWESPALGAWGLGWEVWLDGMEVTQFTYFQQAGGMPLDSVAVEITYGLERIIMSLQGKTHFKDIVFAPNITYGDIFMQNEIEMSKYNLDHADVLRNNQMFELYEKEALALLQKRLPVPAYNYLLKASHTFNILDSRGAIGVTERARYFQRMRTLARDVAKLWVDTREEIGYPLLPTNLHVEETSEQPRLVSKDISAPVADFVFEIGVEELPPADVSGAITQVGKLLSGILADLQLSYSSLDVDGTPRRITAYVRDMKTRQDDETKRVRGPPLRVALKDGEKTKAATGFLRTQGVTDENVVEYDEGDGYMYATVNTIGRSAVDVLAESLPKSVLAKINFERSMRWNNSGVSFSRPIRWILCLLDDQLIPFEYANVRSSKSTRSLRGSDGFAKTISVPSAGAYHDVLSDIQIVPFRKQRAKHIRSQAALLAREIGGVVPEEYLKGSLLDEITDLVENPIPLLGRFDESFLDLPAEVLITVMKKHQRYLPIKQEGTGKLLNGFITVVNGDSSLVDLDAIRRGNEAVLRARYSDAAFFYKKDTEGKKLEDFVSQLSGLTFQESLGSMLDKMNRVKRITADLCNLFNMDVRETDNAISTASLYKADLATSMVIEMTSLAGTMGQHYTQKSGEVPSNVSRAIFEANLPRFSGDEIAKSREGATVAIADRLDSLVALFSVGLMPKATADPFALRRAALGIVQTVIGCGLQIDIRNAVALAGKSLMNQTGNHVGEETTTAVADFITRRLEGHLLDGLNFRDDVVKAVLSVESNAMSPLAAFEVCQAISAMFGSDADANLVATAQETHERAARLLKGIKDLPFTDLEQHAVDSSIFECPEEEQLLNALSSVTRTGDVHARIQQLANLKGVVDDFFDNVFVNAEQDAVRLNRLALCARISAISNDLLDLSLLQI